jgi:hypothetical protein
MVLDHKTAAGETFFAPCETRRMTGLSAFRFFAAPTRSAVVSSIAERFRSKNCLQAEQLSCKRKQTKGNFMTPEKYVQSAGQLRFMLERMRAIANRMDSLPAPKDSAAASRRLALGRVFRTTDHLTKALTINFGHSEEGLAVLSATTVGGKGLDAEQVEFIRDQTADELAYKHAFSDSVTDEQIAEASAIEIQEMLPFLQSMVDRCASLLTAEC